MSPYFFFKKYTKKQNKTQQCLPLKQLQLLQTAYPNQNQLKKKKKKALPSSC